MKKIYQTAAFLAAALLLVSLPSCRLLKDVSNTMANIDRLKFKISRISDVKIAGISIAGKQNISDLSTGAVAKLAASAMTKQFPVSFTMVVSAQNPNDGTGGKPATKSTISSMPWALYINDRATVSGNIEQPVHVPGTGESVDIPISIGMDFYNFFKNKGYKELVNLALAISGTKGSSSDIKLKARPSISTPYGSIQYPGELTIVKNKWSN